VAIKEFLFCSLLVWQIGIIIYILLSKFYGKTSNQDTKISSTPTFVEPVPPKKKIEHVDIVMKKNIIMEKTNISSIKSDEEIKGKVSTQKDKLKQLRRR
tara:strand:- start:450 stop:746 length:297 start_codon:yes stop_codon:yes gene_type:complete